MQKQEKFARRVFMVAGIYGLVVLVPQYFLEDLVNRSGMPITHPEYFYGFIGIAVAWQVAFLVIARDVVRFRVLMLPAILEKAAFGGAVSVLWFHDRVAADVLAAGLVDLLIGVFFVAAFFRLRDMIAVPGEALSPVTGSQENGISP